MNWSVLPDGPELINLEQRELYEDPHQLQLFDLPRAYVQNKLQANWKMYCERFCTPESDELIAKRHELWEMMQPGYVSPDSESPVEVRPKKSKQTKKKLTKRTKKSKKRTK
jgi:hypothetical protein